MPCQQLIMKQTLTWLTVSTTAVKQFLPILFSFLFKPNLSALILWVMIKPTALSDCLTQNADSDAKEISIVSNFFIFFLHKPF